jgi:hypothetical protein
MFGIGSKKKKLIRRTERGSETLRHAVTMCITGVKKLTAGKLPKELPAFYRTRVFFTVLTRTWHTLSQMNPANLPSYFLQIRSNNILLSTPCSSTGPRPVPSGVPTKRLCATCLAHFILRVPSELLVVYALVAKLLHSYHY